MRKFSKTGRRKSRRFSMPTGEIIRRRINIKETSILEPGNEKLYHGYQALRTIYQVLHDCNTESDPKLILKNLIKSLYDALDADRGAIVIEKRDKEGQRERMFIGENGAESEFPLPHPILNEVIKTNVSIISTEPGKEESAKTSKNPHAYTVICTPLGAKEKVFGAIYFDRVHYRNKMFKIEDMELLAAVGIQVGGVLEKSLLLNDLRRANQRLEKTQQNIIQQERLRALGEMASGIAHDFNNALSPIVGFSELLLLCPHHLDNREKLVRHLKTIHRSAQDAAKTVKRLRNFYRHRDIGELFTPVDLNLIIKQTVELTKPKWKEQAHALGYNIEMKKDLQELPLIPGNEAELREVLTNLIFNAVDALTHKDGAITVRTRDKGKWISLEVCDTGVGMSESTQKRCLEPFFSTKGEHGTGLGLSMVFGIVQRHEGNIDIRSRWGQGTSFLIELPKRNTKISVQKKQKKKSLRPLHILAIDDETDVLSVLSECLRSENHSVETADGGLDGLKMFKKGKFDTVITDLAMPNMNGKQVAKAIKQIDPRIPVIMFTGFGDMITTSGEKPDGVDYIVSKPFSFDKLRNVLVKL